jgi:hypothetical protein
VEAPERKPGISIFNTGSFLSDTKYYFFLCYLKIILQANETRYAHIGLLHFPRHPVVSLRFEKDHSIISKLKIRIENPFS